LLEGKGSRDWDLWYWDDVRLPCDLSPYSDLKLINREQVVDGKIQPRKSFKGLSWLGPSGRVSTNLKQ